MRILATVVGTAVVALAPAAAHPHPHVLGHANPAGGYAGDVYAHGRYAYLSSWHGSICASQGVRIYDLANPRKPRRLATFADGRRDIEIRGTWTEKTIVQHVTTPTFTGELAATSFQNCPGTNSFRGFGLYDVTDPRHPKRLSIFRTEPGGVHELWLQEVNGRVYVYAAIPLAELYGQPQGSGFRIYDVTDPRHPSQVGAWIAPQSLREGKRIVFVHSVRVNPAGTRAYVSYWDLGTVILDITKPSDPRYLGHTTDPQGAAHSTALSADGKLMIETHERDGGRPSFWDVSDPRNPRLLSVFHAPKRLVAAARRRGAAGLSLGVHDPKIVGNRAYFSWYALGVLVVDISHPRHPRFVTQFLPKSTRDPDKQFCPGRRCTITWGVYAERKFALAADMLSGLWVFRVR
jgi:hypothetical protein